MQASIVGEDSMKLRTATGMLLAALVVSSCGRKAMEQTDTKAAVPVSVETAVSGTIESTLSATGVVQPAPGGGLDDHGARSRAHR